MFEITKPFPIPTHSNMLPFSFSAALEKQIRLQRFLSTTLAVSNPGSNSLQTLATAVSQPGLPTRTPRSTLRPVISHTLCLLPFCHIPLQDSNGHTPTLSHLIAGDATLQHAHLAAVTSGCRHVILDREGLEVERVKNGAPSSKEWQAIPTYQNKSLTNATPISIEWNPKGPTNRGMSINWRQRCLA